MLDRVLVAMMGYHGCLNSGDWVPGLGEDVVDLGDSDGRNGWYRLK